MLSASDTKMKKALLTGVAALFLTTGAAHAFHEYRKCGKTFVDIDHAHATIDGERRFWRELTIIENPKGGSPPLNSFRCNDLNKCWLNGKLCRNMSYEEWEKEFPEPASESD
jgi:hypothetical protein